MNGNGVDYSNQKIISVEVSYINGVKQIIVPIGENEDILYAFYDDNMEMYVIYQQTRFWSFPRESVCSFMIGYEEDNKHPGFEVVK